MVVMRKAGYKPEASAREKLSLEGKATAASRRPPIDGVTKGVLHSPHPPLRGDLPHKGGGY